MKTLEDMGEKTAPEDLKNYWMCFAIPKDVLEKKKGILKEFEVLKETFYEDI
jgi:hypothetical protein